jgi:DNA-binding transcriptional ArsR family regulator
MLRIHFTGEDLARVRLAPAPDPLWETVMTLFRFRTRSVPLVFERWRKETIGRSRRSTLDLLMPLAPGGYFPDFITPSEAALGIEAGIDAVLSTSKERLRTEIGLLAADPSTLPAGIQALGRGDRAALGRLGEALRLHHQVAVAPHWTQIQAHVEADRVKRSRAWLDGGCEGMLNSFRPLMRWQFPVLEVDFPVEQDLYLDGRGLLLVPSYFSWAQPDALHDPSLSPVLVYPVEHAPRKRGPADDDGNAESLGALIGATRAWILAAVDEGCTTGELARRVGVAASSISQHTTVLRDAGLVRTTRAGKSVMHTVTPLGKSLIEGDTATWDAERPTPTAPSPR